MIPWLIHEAEVALYPAWLDGMPYQGPGLLRGGSVPILSCPASLSITETKLRSAGMGFSSARAEPAADAEWEISVSFPDGWFSDAHSFIRSRLPDYGWFILVVRFVDPRTRCWSLLRFFFVTPQSDEAADSGEAMYRTLRFKAAHLQESGGGTAIPAMLPTVQGEVDWICGPQRITALLFDPEAETWTSTSLNETGDGTRYVNLSPVQDSATDAILTGYFPRVQPDGRPAGFLSRGAVTWTNTYLLRIGNHLSPVHHGLTLLGGLNVQTIGIAEPLLAHPQSRMLDEPVIVFRYLRRVYATIGHGVLAVPELHQNATHPFTHDPAFRLIPAATVNPATQRNGLTLLPTGAWLDGTVL